MGVRLLTVYESNILVTDRIEAAVLAFDKNAESVRRLLDFDRFVLDVALRQLETLKESTERQWGRILRRLGDLPKDADDLQLNPRLSVDRTIQMLRGWRDQESLKPQYELMINQALVLLVSYFGSGVRDVLRAAVIEAVTRRTVKSLLKFELRARVEEFQELDRSIPEFIGDQFVEASDLSFQDMKSIGRTLRDYFAIDHERDANLNDIIAGQACRHAIVHSGLTADARLTGQLKGARPRTVKPDIRQGERIQFTAAEVLRVEEAMRLYLGRTADSLRAAVQPAES